MKFYKESMRCFDQTSLRRCCYQLALTRPTHERVDTPLRSPCGAAKHEKSNESVKKVRKKEKRNVCQR